MLQVVITFTDDGVLGEANPKIVILKQHVVPRPACQPGECLSPKGKTQLQMKTFRPEELRVERFSRIPAEDVPASPSD